MTALIVHRSRYCFFSLLITLFLLLTPLSFLFGKTPETGLVAAPDSHATQIARMILNQGGNAIDAGIAAMFALSVVQPYASGIGGGGFMLIWRHYSKEAIVIDFREQAPQYIDPSTFYQDNVIFNIYTKYGYRSIGVPGMVAGAEQALKAYGTMTLQQLLKPAIEIATHGFVVTEALSNLIAEYYEILESDRASSSIFLPDWYPLDEGQILARSDLANTLNLITQYGANAVYHGEIAASIANELKANNGFILLTDLQNYQPTVRSTIRGNYRDVEIISVPPPSSGGTALIELLKILERFKLNTFQLNSGPYIHLMVEVMKQVFQDRENYFLGDPKFESTNPPLVLSTNHLQKCFQQIDTSKVRPVLDNSVYHSNQERSTGSHISIIDPDGNAISISQTLGSFFGSGITISKYGILLNNALNNFADTASRHNSIAPGKRPQATLAPTIVLKNGKPYLVLGGSGAERIISMLAQVIINVVDFNLSLEEAVCSPRFHYNLVDNTIEMETRIEANAIDYLKKLGHKISLRQDHDVYFGSVQAVLSDPNNQVYTSVKDIRQEGMVYIQKF